MRPRGGWTHPRWRSTPPPPELLRPGLKRAYQVRVMRRSGDRGKILSALEKWLKAPSPLPVKRVLTGERPSSRQPAFFMEVPRLIMIVRGRGTFLTVKDGREEVFDLSAGQVLFLAPCTWICPMPRVAYVSLGAVLRPDSTRLTLYARKGMGREIGRAHV